MKYEDYTQEDHLIELKADEVNFVTGGVLPVLPVLGLFALGYTIGKDLAARRNA
ncbi:MAG: hypothetical protein Q4G49_02830 [Paracoccus sp. (in: a-proteobacteria)]|nr:hypothetical protein [Paracoccus sp. (in: a-proteobacteria)]